MRNTVLVLLTIVFFTSICAHGVAKPIKVRIQAEKGAANEGAKSIAARLKGTERYAVTDGDAELYLDLDCMEGKDSGVSVSHLVKTYFLNRPRFTGCPGARGPEGKPAGAPQ
jgi:hypothetical protein